MVIGVAYSLTLLPKLREHIDEILCVVADAILRRRCEKVYNVGIIPKGQYSSIWNVAGQKSLGPEDFAVFIRPGCFSVAC
jgi:hypothetical protein